MRRFIIGTVSALAMAATALADSAGIEGTIGSQLRAFQADDFETAFTYASPNLRRYFQTPGNFQRMVTQGYPMVWRFSGVQFLGLREEGGAFWQRVQITDLEGVVHLLDYRMIETPEGWRINGVVILDPADFAA